SRRIVRRRRPAECLTQAGKGVLEAAAFEEARRCFSFKLLTAICEIDVDELFTIVEKAQKMGVIVASSEAPEKPFTFSHELVRQTLLAGISTPRRQHLHAGVAHAIARLQSDAANERAGDIDIHLIKADRSPTETGRVSDAGRQGRTRGCRI
ncbi:MAG: hypothetical protein WBE69_14130, partial [Candidatus Binataceae bacterium]